MFKIKVMLAKALDAMIAQKGAKGTSLFEAYKSGTAWFVKFKEVCEEYKSLADPDALKMIPEFIDVFEEKKQYVTMTYARDPETRDALLLSLSQCRKEMGFDELERKARRNNTVKNLDRAR